MKPAVLRPAVPLFAAVAVLLCRLRDSTGAVQQVMLGMSRILRVE